MTKEQSKTECDMNHTESRYATHICNKGRSLAKKNKQVIVKKRLGIQECSTFFIKQ